MEVKYFFTGVLRESSFAITTRLEGRPLDSPQNKKEARQFAMHQRGRNVGDALRIGLRVMSCLFSLGKKSMDDNSIDEDYDSYEYPDE